MALRLPTTYDSSAAVKRSRDDATCCSPFDALRQAVVAGESSSLFYCASESVFVMYDAYPKATVHLLALPFDVSIDSLSSLLRCGKEKALAVLGQLKVISDAILLHLKAQTSLQHLTFQCGFHAFPSLKPLHLHIVSQDFEMSPFLRTKVHYNSFCTAFFLPLDSVILSLRRCADVGEITACLIGSHKGVAPDIKCFWCGVTAKNMPTLISHLKCCERNKCRLVA